MPTRSPDLEHVRASLHILTIQHGLPAFTGFGLLQRTFHTTLLKAIADSESTKLYAQESCPAVQTTQDVDISQQTMKSSSSNIFC